MHWRNSQFGIKNFLANKCHTPDEAYRVLCELREDRDVAIKNAEASDLRTQAKIVKANSIIENTDSTPWDVLEAEADKVEVTAFKEQGEAVLKVGHEELEYINSLIDEIQPQRKYKDLPDNEAHQIAQEEEWKEELIWRAQNFLASQGSIPHDHLSTMRLHPAWETALLPQIEKIVEAQKNNEAFLPNHKPIFAIEDKTDEQA